MTGYGLSPLEICRIIEGALLPNKCICRFSDGRTLSILVTSQDDPGKITSFDGIELALLANSRAIASLVIDLRAKVLKGGGEQSCTQRSQAD